MTKDSFAGNVATKRDK